MAIRQKTKSLKYRQSKFSDSFYQLEVLNAVKSSTNGLMPFDKKLEEYSLPVLKPNKLEVFQINIGKLCNQSCAHCHVDAGPDQTEANMSRSTLKKCLDIIKNYDIPTVDITGGAPEMNPGFRWFVEELAILKKQILVRCNLTIIVANKKYHDLPQFFAANRVQVISSLPYFTKLRTDSQRGDGVFKDSITALKKLNEMGYGKENNGLILDLVYNPSGAYLPGDQQSLEAEFKRQLQKRYGIVFNNLYAITNLPISRFMEYLISSGNYDRYMNELVAAFNPATVNGLMCRNTLSISWDGYIYDCDFNQMLDLKSNAVSNHIDHFDIKNLSKREIVVNQHCYGCTAGAGSSCGGEIVT